MEPAFYRGDLLFLTNPRNTPYVVGDITVYKVPGGDIPIVHRVIETHQKWVALMLIHVVILLKLVYRSDSPVDQAMLTKGGKPSTTPSNKA